MQFSGSGSKDSLSSLYVLKHKDLDVAMVQIDNMTGSIEYILDIYIPEELPLGCDANGGGVKEWWKARAIPESRKGIRQVLNSLNEKTSQSLMLSAYGLSLTDHYWLQPVDREYYWKDLNFYENDFSDELGKLLTDSGELDLDFPVSKFSPSSSVNGEMRKKWVILDGARYLLKVSQEHYGQQAVNEAIAGKLHELTGWKNYIPYRIDKAVIEGKNYPCSLSPLFTSQELEFVPAYQIIRNHKVPNNVSVYEALIRQAGFYGMREEEVRNHLEYAILTDFLLTNTDRHFNNFGFLYDEKQHRLVSMAPIFDTGNALFYNEEAIPSKENLLNIEVNSFSKKETEMLRYVKNSRILDLPSLESLPKEAEMLLKKYTDMPGTRAEKIGKTIGEKMEYLHLFQQGSKIWRRKKYW